eukprot:6288263-Amphidinium_carterae.1
MFFQSFKQQGSFHPVYAFPGHSWRMVSCRRRQRMSSKRKQFKRPKKVRRQENIGVFSVAPIVKRSGIQIGWGATCGLCPSASTSTSCKRQLAYGGGKTTQLTDVECRLKLKRWLLLGSTVATREEHMAIPVRELVVTQSEAELDALLSTL